MTMTIAKFYNDEKYYVLWDGEEKVKEGSYSPNLKYIDKKSQEKFKKEFGIDLKNFDGKILDELEEKIPEERKEDFEEFLDELPYAPQAYQGVYCEDIVLKEDIEKLENEEVLFIDGDTINSIVSDCCFDDKYYFYWDGSNWRAKKIEEFYEIEAEEIDCDELNCNDCSNRGDCHYNCYKTKKRRKFRIFCSHYQGELDFIDEECEDGLKILEEAK